MKHTTLAIALALCVLPGAFSPLSAQDDLAKGFAQPPNEAKPWVYWWWLNGAASKEGITRDFEEMRRQGIAGALLFDAGAAGADAPRGPFFMSAEWRELFKHAVREASRCGLVLSVNLCSGWDAGGTRIGSVRKGGGWMVIEADESDKSLMVFKPEHAIITNASADHFGLGETLSLFESFRARVPGVVIDGQKEAGGPEGVRLEGWNGFFTFEGTEYCVPMPGLHNVHNAWHAVRMARALGAAPDKLVDALRAFGGVERRLQRVGACGGAAVVDDYAHNPEKLAAAYGF